MDHNNGIITDMHFFRRLKGTEKEWEFFRGETRIIHDFIPEDSIPFDFVTNSHIFHMKTWEIEDEDILDYNLRLTPNTENLSLGINDYEHVFTALKPGTTFAFCTHTKRKIPVTIHNINASSRIGFLTHIFRRMLLK